MLIALGFKVGVGLGLGGNELSQLPDDGDECQGSKQRAEDREKDEDHL